MRRHEFINEEIVKEIIQFIRGEHDREALLSRLDDYHDYDIAQALEEMTPEERKELYSKMGEEWTAEIFSYYDEPETLLTELAPRRRQALLSTWILTTLPSFSSSFLSPSTTALRQI